MIRRGQHGWVEVVAGCMFSGKTTELVRRLTRASIAKQNVAAFKPVVDDRHDSDDIVTHEGVYTDRQQFKAQRVKRPADIYDLVEKMGADVVGIDEAQFFNEDLPNVVETLARTGKRVILAGLDLDFRGQPFGSMPELMARADEVMKTYAVCTVCGAPATRSQRIADSQDQVLVGAERVYQARCRTHWSPQPMFTRAAEQDQAEG